jgi:hypothetical protein
MKKTLAWIAILFLAATSLLFAQRVSQRGRILQLTPTLTLTVAQSQFAVGDSVLFTLRTGGTPASLQNCYYTIERHAGGNNWAEFYRSSQGPLDNNFMPANSAQDFEWTQTNTAGTQLATPGQWRIEFFLPPGTPGSPLVVNFSIAPYAGGGGSGALLQMKLMRYKLVRGQTATFRLQNVGNQAANLQGHRYVIQYRAGNRWVDFFQSSVNALGIGSLGPGQVYKFTWHLKSRTGQPAMRGEWRIVFFAPNVPNSPVDKKFTIS